MFNHWKQKLEEKKAMEEAVAKSRYWRTHPKLQACLQAMRGSCTLASQELHEAAIAAVNIAFREGTWTCATQFPGDFLSQTIYLVWDDEQIPVLKAPRDLVVENLSAVTAVAEKTFLVSKTMEQIIWFDDHNQIKLYSIA